MEMLVFAEGTVATRPGIFGPLIGADAVGDNVEHEKGLEGLQVTGLEQEALELGVEVALEGLISRSEDGDIVAAHGFLEGLEEEGLLDELGELGVVGVEEGDEDGVGVDLGGGVGLGGGQCGGGGE